ncbi:MAG: DUF2283 domain-containing protein [Methanosarcinales archaeon]
MKVKFDPEANILYISIKDEKVEDMKDINDEVWVEYNRNDEIIGIEIHCAKEIIVPEIIKFLETIKKPML